MSIKEQLTSLGWSIKPEVFENNKLKLDEIKKQLLDVNIINSFRSFFHRFI